ncbi:MAG: hypothetical protein O9343_18995 [Burkholderiaceae bacterium]|nr:hypothetical protein [Burkholderiaceae bacterium]
MQEHRSTDGGKRIKVPIAAGSARDVACNRRIQQPESSMRTSSLALPPTLPLHTPHMAPETGALHKPRNSANRTLDRLVCKAAGLLASVLVLLASTAQAAAPMAGTNPPGFYRIMLGSFEVTSLSDGTLPSFSLQQLFTNN